MKLTGRFKHFPWTLLVGGLVLGGSIGTALYYGTSAYFMREAEERVLDLLLQNRALHEYIQSHTHPALYRMKAEGVIDSDFYSAELLSSSFMARHVTELLNEERAQHGLPEIVYRIGAVNPRNPVNTANHVDSQLIEFFNADRTKTSLRQVVATDSGKYLHVSLPFLETGEACMKCHGSPSSAPRQLVEAYDTIAGFNAEPGGIRAIETIEAPLESDLIQARLLFAALLVAFLSMAGLVLVVSGLRRKVRSRTAELAASEQKYRTLVEDLPCFVCVFLPDGTLTYVNRLMAEYFRTPSDSMVGRKMPEIVRPDIWKEAVSRFEKLTADAPIGADELQVKVRDGSTHWQRWIFRAIFDSQGDLACYQAYGEDVTERKLAEAAIRESEARFSTVFHASPIGISISRMDDGTVIDVNDAMLKLTGFCRDEVVGHSSAELDIYSDDAARAGVIALLREKGCIRNSEGKLRTKSGEIQEILTSAEIIQLDGQPHMLASVMDVSEWKRAERALRESEQRNRALLDAIPDAMSLMDADGRVIDFRGAAEGLEMPGETMLGRVIDEAPMPPNVLAEIKGAIAAALESGTIQQIEHDLGTPHGIKSIEARFVKCSDSTVLSLVRNVTDRKQTEEALRKSETVMRGIFDSAPVGIILVAADRTMLNVNAALCSLSGYTAAELIGRSAQMLYMSEEEFGAAGRDLYGQMREHGVGVEVKCMRHKDGHPIFVILRLSSCDPNDPGAGVIATVLDVTDRRQAEDALRKSVQSYRALAENIPCAVYRVHLRDNNRVEFFNDWITRITGYGIDELPRSGMDFLVDRVHPDDRSSMADSYTRAIREMTSFAVSYRLVHRDGGVRYLLTRGSVVPGTDDTPLHVDGVTIDLTERIHADEALRQSERKYRSYVDNAPDAVMVVDRHGRLIEVNPAAERLTGYSRDELLKITMADLLSSDVSNAIMAILPELDQGAPKRGELAIRCKDGREVWWSVDGVKLSEDRYLAFCVDVTETRRLRELESRAQRLETAGRIAGQVAHDFNNLLAPLTAYPDLIREDLPRDHPALAFLSSIEESAQQIAEINQQLLTLGRRGHYNQEPMNLNEIVHQVLKQMETPPDSLVVTTDLAEDLMLMLGGRSQIHRALMNLVQNAREAIQDVGQISIRTENFYIDELSTNFARVPRGEYVKLTVADDGCGIPSEIIEKVFDPFFTTKTADRKRGSGLGLSVVDSVVNDHHGYIDLDSRIGKGTSIFLYFPITREIGADVPVEAVSGGDELILVVDDDRTQREVCMQILTRLGYRVEEAAGGEEALHKMRAKAYDLIILDMIMPPGIDGAETYLRALEIRPHQRAVMLSGFAESDRVIVAQQIGAGAFLRKPVTRTILARAVRHELDRTAANAAHTLPTVPAG